MLNKILILINNLEDIKEYEKLGIKNFAIYLKNFSVFYEKSYTLKDIINIDNVFIVINKILSTKMLEDLKKELKKVPKNIKGFIISDLGIYDFLKTKNKNIILNLRHFGTNHESINAFLDLGFNSYILANELTFLECKKIVSNLKKPIILEILSHNQVSYSKRNLITNYNDYYNESLNNLIIIKDNISNQSFMVKEEENATIFLTEKIYNGTKLLDIDSNVLFYFINTTLISKEIIVNLIKAIKNNKKIRIPLSNSGFLNKKTIYKVKR